MDFLFGEAFETAWPPISIRLERDPICLNLASTSVDPTAIPDRRRAGRFYRNSLAACTFKAR